MKKIAGKHDISIITKKGTGIAAATPALLMCFVTLMILLLDVGLPEMGKLQYVVYPAAMRIVSLAGILCAAACFSRTMSAGTYQIDLKSFCFVGFAICMLISTSVNGINHDAIFGMAYRYVGVYDLLIFIFAYMYCSGCIVSRQLKRIFLVSYIGISCLIALIFIYDFFSENIEAFRNKAEPAAIFFHGNHYGYFLVMAVIISVGCYLYFERNLMIFGALSGLLNLAALALNRSMGCIIAVGMVLIAMIAVSVVKGGRDRQRGLLLLAALVTICASALICITSLREDMLTTLHELIQILSGDNNVHAGNGRWGIWQYVAGYIADYPLWGYGCEGITEIMRPYTLIGNPHNEPLTYASFFGIPAAVLYCLGVAAAVSKGLQSGNAEQRTAAFTALGYFISSVFGVAMFYTVPFMFVLMGISAGKNEANSNY